MAQPLWQVLKDPEVVRKLQQHPTTFRFEHGASLVVSAVGWLPHLDVQVHDDGSLSVVGPVANMLNSVAQSLNFTYRLVTPADQYWGAKLPNGTWTGMVGQVARKESDIALGPFGLTEDRYRDVDYTRSFFFDHQVIFSAKGLPEINPWGFFFPLAPAVWATLMAVMMISWIAAVVLGRQPKGSGGLIYASDLFFHNLRVILRQDMTMKLLSVRERLVVGGWLLVAMMVTWSYTGNLVSLLAVRHIPQPIQTIRHLLDDSSLTLILLSNAVFADIISKIKIGEMKEVNDLQHKNRMKYMVSIHYTTTEKLMSEGGHAIIDTALSADDFIGQSFADTRRCDFYKSRQKFFTTHHCMIGQKGNPIVPAISYRIRSLVEAGLYEYWLRNNIPFSSHCKLSPSTLTLRQPLAINNLWWLFLLFNADASRLDIMTTWVVAVQTEATQGELTIPAPGMLMLLGAGHLLALVIFFLEVYVV
ncbi:probable glutamate receptor [Panulirus ornatus]|uniref:probable glutamate receptor n=1 Tax=Panulirus ornatus TaxID=150431 RepID=UPI003A8785E0